MFDFEGLMDIDEAKFKEKIERAPKQMVACLAYLHI